jgi:hypothetical protein
MHNSQFTIHNSQFTIHNWESVGDDGSRPVYAESGYRVDSGVAARYIIVEVISMATTKAYLNIKIDSGAKEAAAQTFQPESALTLDEQLLATIRKKNIPEARLESDEKGNLFVDKEKHPDVHDWLMNG